MSEEEKLLREAKKLPWDDRLLHKNWKVRNEANVDLAAVCGSVTDPKDPRLREFGPLFKKTLADSNAPVQEKALDALIAFLRAADADAGRYAKEVCDVIVAKCLTGRPKTVEKSQAAFMLWVELEAVEAFLDAMEKAIKNKVAKAVVPAIDVMFQALSEFGAKVVPPKRLLKMLPELFDHQDQSVRASSKGLTLELCHWIGKDPVKSILFEKMRDTMRKELEAELANVMGTAKPSRKIRSEQDKEPESEAVLEVVGPVHSEEVTSDAPQEIDEYDLLDPVDIMTPLEKSGFWDGVKATKWSDRRDGVAELTKLASTKRIVPGDFSEVCRTLKKLVMDVNIAVAVEAIQAIGNLAHGLRTHFSGCSRFLLPVLIEKLKEKKPVLTESLTRTLQAMHKTGCLILLTLLKCLNDGTLEVRDSAFLALAAIAKLVGLRPLERSLEKLDDVRRKKLSEMIAGSGGSVPAGTVSATIQTVGGSNSSVGASEGSFAKKSAASMLTGRESVPAAPANKRVGSSKPGANRKGDVAARADNLKSIEPLEDIEPAEMSLVEIESRLGSLVQVETVSQLKSTVWKERLEAISSLKAQVEELQVLDQSVEILICLLCAVPGWNEKNVQVQQQVLETIAYIASTASKFPKKCVVLCLLGISERVADIKTRAHAMKCLTTFSEAVGPGFIFERLNKIMKEHKNPKVLSEGVLWMVSAVEDFGIAHLKLKDLIDFCKDVGLQSSVAASRNASIKLLGALHKFVGSDIKGFLADVKPALLSALDAEFEKNPLEVASAVPKKTVRALESVTSVSTSELDGLPREDISGKITPVLLKSLESGDWKVRLESIETVNKILEEANKRIQPTGTGELFGALRGRLYDSNKNLAMATLTTIGGTASAMGPAVEKSCKGILLDILKCLGDNKRQMRECALVTLDSWFAAVHLDKMDKSSDVRKAAEACVAEILRASPLEMIEKSLKDIQGPALALVLERVKSYGALQESLESPVANSMGLASKGGLKGGKSAASGASRQNNRAVSSRVMPTKGTQSESLISVQDRAFQSEAILNAKDSNKVSMLLDIKALKMCCLHVFSEQDDRERMVVRRFKFEEPRIEQIQELESDMIKYFREDLYKQFLSNDFKKQVDGLEMLQKELPSIRKEIIKILDILLRWFVLLFCKSNTTCLLKVLEFLPKLFDMLQDEEYMLTESEAAIFLPCLTEKLGHNIEKVREKLRELTKQIVNTYSAAKTFPYILEGLRSKNNRTRIESADLVGFLIDHHGAEITGQLRSLQIVASLTAERDGEIRKAVLNALATGYKHLGDDIWKYVGKLTDAQRSMLDDRFKWKFREMEKKKEGRLGDARAALRCSVRDNGPDLAEQSGEISESISGPIFTRKSVVAHELRMDRHVNSNAFASVNGPTNWNEALDIISLGSPEQSVEGMKIVCHELAQATNDPEGSMMDELMKDSDRLVLCLANKVAKTFDFSLTGASSRSCKYVLNTLMQAFQNKRLAYAVKESTLHSLMTELLLWLLDERVPCMDEGSQLLKALNVLMLKILDNADRTSSFVVLINLLHPLHPARWPSPASSETLTMRNQKFSDLVVKCLIKLTKVLQSTIYDVDLDCILQSIHIYLQELGMKEIKRRAGADDKPLLMVKTVLHELVKLCGAAIKGHLSMVPMDMKPQPIILAYIDLNLETLAAARMLTSTGPAGQTHWVDSTANNSSTATHSADAQLKQELAAIFKKIGDKQTCTIGLYELYRITQLYPKVDIFVQLQNASKAFCTYIRDGLAQMEKNAAAGRTPSSLPMSTPPPPALAASSPEYASLLPVHKNALNNGKLLSVNSELTNFHLPPSYAEDKRTGTGLGFKKLVGGVTSGTLDAIRERMKSMQSAAAVGSLDSGIRPLASMSDNINNGVLCQARVSDSAVMENSIQSGAHPKNEKALSGLQAQMEGLKSGY